MADVQICGASTTGVYYVKGLARPPNTSVKVVTQGEKLMLAENTELGIETNTADSVDAKVSYVEIS